MSSKLVLAIVVFALAVSTVAAVSDLRPAGRFDDRVRAREGGNVGVLPRDVTSLDPSDTLRREWEQFGERHGGWRIYLDERSGMPLMASGRGMDWFAGRNTEALTLDELESRALAFLAEHGELFASGMDNLELDLAASRKLQRNYWQLVFRQVVDGVRVENARFDLHVKQGRLVLFGATFWGTPSVETRPTVDVKKAQESVDRHIEASTAEMERVGEPELTIVALDASESSSGAGLRHSLLWRFRFREPDRPALWVAEVDAHDGRVLAFYDGAHYNAIRGGVFPIANDGDCLDGGCEVAGFPMPFSDYEETGQPEAYADVFGNLQCVDPVASLETNLAGPYIRVEDTCGPVAESGSCGTGVDLGFKNGENCDVMPGASPGNSAAARSAYYHLNRAAEAARFYDPTNTWLQQQLVVKVNAGGTCNAFWNGDINMYGSGGGCGNTGELHGVLIHEWGHGYDENDGGGFDETSEAYADVAAIFAARDSCVGRGWFNDGQTCSGYGDACLTCTGIRDHDWAARERNTPTTPENFVITCPSGPGGPCSKEAHCESYPISETIYDLATRDLPAAGLDPDTAWQLAERLWYESRPGSGGEIYNCFRWNLTFSCSATHWFQRMRVADDDDGDLSNGTPHAAALYAAFDRHQISCGNVGDPEHQSTSTCPTLSAPTLSVVELPTGTQLSWSPVAGAGEYRVYRGELGCDRQQVPIASLASGQLDYLDDLQIVDLPRHYRVEALGSNPACHSPVSNCVSTPLGARLQKNGHRLVEPVATENGIPDPGETLHLPVTAFNSGVDPAQAVHGRLRMTNPSQGRVLAADATWTDIAAGDALESDAPSFEFTVFEDVLCGDTLDFEVELDASNASPHRRPFQLVLGEPDRDFVSELQVPIPAETTTPVTSTLVVDQDLTVAEVDVSVNIDHPLESELIVELTSPDGTTVRLHDQSELPSLGLDARFDLDRAPDGPGTMEDFIGESTAGTWALSIQDVGVDPVESGPLQDWALHLTVNESFDCVQTTCAEATPSEAVGDLQLGLTDSGSGLDLDFSWGAVAGVAGYHLIQSEDAPFQTAVELTGTTAGATTLVSVNGANTMPPLTYFLVRGVNSCNQEGP